MKEDFLPIPVMKNGAGQRFELRVDGYTAFIDYQERGNNIKIIHTESPEEIAGRGVATASIEKTLQYIEANKYVLTPVCPLVFCLYKKTSGVETYCK